MPVQQPSPAPQAPPAPPAPPGPGSEPIVVQMPVRPLTRMEEQAIRTRRSELSSQLSSASDRREELVERLKTAEGVDRAGLEERLRVLDERIVQLETDIAVTGRMLTNGLTPGTSTTEVPDVPYFLSPDQVTGISIVFIIAVMMPIAIAKARRMWRHAPAAINGSDMRDITTKLEGLQQAVDTVAIEVERVSEGQRFVTRLMTEGPAAGRALVEGGAGREAGAGTSPKASRLTGFTDTAP